MAVASPSLPRIKKEEDHWHALDSATTVQHLKSSTEQGLSDQEAAHLLAVALGTTQ